MIVGLITVFVATLLVILPFFVSEQRALQEGATVNSLEQLQKMKASLLKRYLEDEEAFQKKLISAAVWQKRKHYLSSRYIDAARREDFLKHLENEEGTHENQ